MKKIYFCIYVFYVDLKFNSQRHQEGAKPFKNTFKKEAD